MNIDQNVRIGERVKAVRKENGLSMEAFGDKVGVKKSTISTVESGKSNPSSMLIKSIGREFHISESWLRTGEGERYAHTKTDTAKLDAIDELCRLYQLNERDRDAIEAYCRMDTQSRSSIRQALPLLAGVVIPALDETRRPWDGWPEATQQRRQEEYEQTRAALAREEADRDGVNN